MRRARYTVARTSDVEPDSGRICKIGDAECAVFQHNGKWHATGSLCPHQNALLDGAQVEDGSIVCSRHGYRYDLESGDCLTIGGYGIPIYPVEVDGEDIVVSVWEFD